MGVRGSFAEIIVYPKQQDTNCESENGGHFEGTIRALRTLKLTKSYETLEKLR